MEKKLNVGSWYRVTLKGRRNENLHGYVSIVYDTGIYTVIASFTDEGKFFRCDFLEKEKALPIDPPKWAKDICIIELADRATLYHRKKKAVLKDSIVNDGWISVSGLIKSHLAKIKELERLVNLPTKV
jgi:hypothetical protein